MGGNWGYGRKLGISEETGDIGGNWGYRRKLGIWEETVVA
jgi:hypothetical protein